MKIAWVLGGSGLLGAALCRELRRQGAEVFLPAERLRWGTGPELAAQIRRAVQAFAFRVGADCQWEIYWAAGVGTMSSSESALAPETYALSLALELIASQQSLMSAPGAIAFASSAGAIYAGSSDEIITEDTMPAPTTAYAREKLKQEELVRSFALATDGTAALIARISTLYGPGQASGKQQGLLAHIARSILRNQPIQIYVPYDTIRDYIAADDAAAGMITSLRAAGKKPRVLLKIIASEHPVTIAEIVSVFRRIVRRTPRIVTSASSLSALYSRRVQFRSIALRENARVAARQLPVGIAQLMAAERSAFVQARVR